MKQVLVSILLLVAAFTGGVGTPNAHATGLRPACPPEDHDYVHCPGPVGGGGSIQNGTYTGLLFIEGQQTVVSAEAAEPNACSACVWTSVIVCRQGALPDDDVPDCAGGETTCAHKGQRRVIVRLVDGGGPELNVADYCEVPNEFAIVTEKDFDNDAADKIQDETPGAPTLTFQPPDGAITQLPTYVAVADQPGALTATFDLPEAPGLRQTVTFAPIDHIWTWGDGGTDTTASPGGPYPDGDVTHTYTHRGTVTLTEQTEYSASYVIHTPFGIDIGPRDAPGNVDGDIAGVTLPVREARAELITPKG